MIEKYSFGKIVIDGKIYSSDIIIYPDGRIQDSWWRKSGHRLTAGDVKELIDSGPEVIIAGIGSAGMMKPDSELEDYLTERGIEFRAMRTGKACDLYNELRKNRKTGACLHLTC